MPAHSTSTKMVIHAYGFLPSQLMSVWKVVFSRPNWELKTMRQTSAPAAMEIRPGM